MWSLCYHLHLYYLHDHLDYYTKYYYYYNYTVYNATPL